MAQVRSILSVRDAPPGASSRRGETQAEGALSGRAAGPCRGQGTSNMGNGYGQPRCRRCGRRRMLAAVTSRPVEGTSSIVATCPHCRWRQHPWASRRRPARGDAKLGELQAGGRASREVVAHGQVRNKFVWTELPGRGFQLTRLTLVDEARFDSLDLGGYPVLIIVVYVTPRLTMSTLRF